MRFPRSLHRSLLQALHRYPFPSGVLHKFSKLYFLYNLVLLLYPFLIEMVKYHYQQNINSNPRRNERSVGETIVDALFAAVTGHCHRAGLEAHHIDGVGKTGVPRGLHRGFPPSSRRGKAAAVMYRDMHIGGGVDLE